MSLVVIGVLTFVLLLPFIRIAALYYHEQVDSEGELFGMDDWLPFL